MSTALDLTVVEAMEKGWALRMRSEHQAILHFQGSGSGSVLVNLIMTFLTLGLYVIAWFWMEIQSAPSQTLIITEVNGEISQKVINS